MSLTTPDVEPLMKTRPPEISDEQALKIAKNSFGLSGRLKKLTSERDANFRLRSADGQGYVIKFTNIMEPDEQTDFQVKSLLHVETNAPQLPVPRVVQTLSGDPWVCVENIDGCKARILTFLDGDIEASVPRTTNLSNSVATAGAHLTKALSNFTHPAANRHLLWDIKQTACLRPMLDAIDDPESRKYVEAAIDYFEESIEPKLPALPWQVIHGDLNPHNLVITDNKNLSVGILDFGDMTRTPRICEAAIAAGYHIDMSRALRSTNEFISIWHKIDPFTEAEISLLPGLMAARFATTITIANWRAKRYPENRDYIMRNVFIASEGIGHFSNLYTNQFFVDKLLQSCFGSKMEVL